MNLQEKREIKRKIKLNTWLGFSTILIMILMFISSFYIRDYLPRWLSFIYIGLMLMMIPLGLYITFKSHLNEIILREHKQKIRQYRTRVLFNKIINLVNQGNIYEGIDLYQQIPQGYIDDVLYGYLISECRHSSDFNLNKRGNDKLLKLLNQFDPDNIIF